MIDGKAAKAALAALTLAAAVSVDAGDIDGHWEGEIEIPNRPLAVKIDLNRDGDRWHGTIDIPAQGATALSLDPVKVEQEADGAAVEFSIRDVPGDPTFVGRQTNGAIRGKFSQGGFEFDFRLARELMARPSRPQEPRAPYPYSAEKVIVESPPVRLAGTLTVPPGDPPFAAVLLISGTGLQDRDQTLFNHKPFWVIADHLTRAGIAVLRLDDAGIGASTPHPEPPTTADFAADAAASVDLLRNDPRFDHVGLLGHSEGGLISVLLASRRDDVDFVVLLAAPGVPGVELMMQQNERVFDAAGLSDELKTALLGLLDQLFAALVSDLPEEELRARVETIALEQIAVSGVTAVQPDDERIRVAVESALQPWMRHFLRLDPGSALAATTVPVLALNGELDVQVDAQQNLSAIASALEKGGNADVDIRRIPGLNHLFQHAETGFVDEYMAIEETISPEVLDLVRDWILGVVR